jgi:type IV pilus assembly protein PilC
MTQKQAKPTRITGLGTDELSILCEQIALIVRSGLPLHDGVEALSENYQSTNYSAAFQTLNSVVQDSGSLYQGLKSAGIFPSYLIEMTNIGERTGELDTVMNDLSVYYQREAKVRRAIRSAITYPIILIVIISTLIFVLITGVLPIFDGVFRSMGLDTSASSWIAAGVRIGKFVLIAAAALIVLSAAAILLTRWDASGRTGAALIKWVKPIRRITTKISAGRFASVMSMMLRSGYPLQDSLKLVSTVVADADVARDVNACCDKMEHGLSFPDAVAQLNIYESLHMRMIRLGFQSGQIEGVMKKISEIYADEVDDAITNAVSIVEPTLAAFMSIIIGSILLAVMLPLFSLMGGMA